MRDVAPVQIEYRQVALYELGERIAFKVSRDPQFAEKLQDILGLSLNSAEQALVLSLDEKSQIQALDRTQPGPSSADGVKP